MRGVLVLDPPTLTSLGVPGGLYEEDMPDLALSTLLASSSSYDVVLRRCGVDVRPAWGTSLVTVYCVFQAFTKQLELQNVALYNELWVETHCNEQPDPPSACLDHSWGEKDVRLGHPS